MVQSGTEVFRLLQQDGKSPPEGGLDRNMSKEDSPKSGPGDLDARPDLDTIADLDAIDDPDAIADFDPAADAVAGITSQTDIGLSSIADLSEEAVSIVGEATEPATGDPTGDPAGKSTEEPTPELVDVIIVGGGPCGLACAVAAGRHGLSHIMFEKGPFLNTLVRFPETMTFFSSAELLEIGDIPFALPHLRPNRAEGIAYFQKVAQHENVNLHSYEPVTSVTGELGNFEVETVDRTGKIHRYRSRAVVMANGYYDHPNMLGIPGEDMEHVKHYYDRPYPYFQQRVIVIGARNSAAQVALELFRHGADVTIVHRGPDISERVKSWIRPDLDARLRNGEITAYFNTEVERIERDRVHLVTRSDASADGVSVGEASGDGRRFTLPADFVLAMTGYRAEHAQLVKLGVAIDDETGEPTYDPDTMETNVPGLYLAGVAAGGHEANILMIENGRFHGPLIAKHLADRLQN